MVLVGEIRDLETAQIALQAAQTGHLVLSTLHTDDSPSAVTRLVDMGIEPYVIGSALVGVVAQRLIRRLCVHCCVPDTPTPDVLRALNLSETEANSHSLRRAVGCDRCDHTGYRGRVGLFEILAVSNSLRRSITRNSGEDALRDGAMNAGMASLGADGIAKVKSGVTTVEELLRVVPELRGVRSVCPGCDAAVDLDFHVCPQCGHRLSPGCPACHRNLQPGWSFCPYCATSIEAKNTSTGGVASSATEPDKARTVAKRTVASRAKAALPTASVTDISAFKDTGPTAARRRRRSPKRSSRSGQAKG